jgi:uncharacterized protein
MSTKLTNDSINSMQVLLEILQSQYDINNNIIPPVEQWNPQNCGDIGLVIKSDGSWWQNGTKFTRHSLVKLFSRILRKDDDGQSYLVTPVEKIIVKIEDAHFTIIRADFIENNAQREIIFTTNVGDVFSLDANHKIWIENNRPYIMVRNNLFALIARAVFYDLVNHAFETNNKIYLQSKGLDFLLGEIDLELNTNA